MSAATDFLAREQSVRFLYPFTADSAGRTLCELLTLQDGGVAVWEEAPVHAVYLEESLPTTVQFLFGAERGALLEGYLRVRSAVAQRWFGNLLAAVFERGADDPNNQEPQSLPLHHHHAAGVEIFLSPCGSGVLSFSFCRDERDGPDGFSSAGLREFTYHLSHLKYRIPVLRKPHPELDPHLMQGPRGGERIALPDPSGPLERRLGHAGGPFTLLELTHDLLGPAEAKGLLRGVQEQLLAYTVARFGAGVTFDRPETRALFVTEAAALAQVEEAAHAPASALEPGVPVLTLNTHHLAACSTLGACHFVADQWPPGEDGKRQGFDTTRVEIAMRKYFTAYVVAVLQRLELIRFRREASALAGEMARHPARPAVGAWDRLAGLRYFGWGRRGGAGVENGMRGVNERFRSLHLDVSRFAASSLLHEVSRREAVNRFYGAAQESLRAGRNLRDLHNILSDIAAASRSQTDSQHLNELAETQRKVEYIEMFIVSFYALEASRVIGASLGFAQVYVGYSAIVAAGVGMATVYVLSVRRQTPVVARRIWTAAVLALVAVWIALGFAGAQGGARTGH